MTLSPSTFYFSIQVPKRVQMGTRVLDREKFFEWLWQTFGSRGLMGVHEGTLLSDQAFEAGFETESFTVDAGEAPRERDWIGSQGSADAALYFDTDANAESARQSLSGDTRFEPRLVTGPVTEQKPQDWDAEWKASFRGIDLPPYWKVLPPWANEQEESVASGVRILRINPGAGFGTGTHETTQLCLTALAERAATRGGKLNERCLDFGSGSGILAIGAALLGASVSAVEIDPLAIDNARDNAELNHIGEQIEYSQTLGSVDVERGYYGVVIANILKPVLLQFAPDLCARLAPGGLLVLSGLVEADVAPIIARFAPLLPANTPSARVTGSGDWRSVVWGLAAAVQSSK